MKELRLAGLLAGVLLAAGCGSGRPTTNLSVGEGLVEQYGEGVRLAEGRFEAEAGTEGRESSPQDAQPEVLCAGNGEFGCPCRENADCLSGFCVTHVGEGACSMTCIDECPQGWTCKLFAGFGDPVYLCISDLANLCVPCSADADCKAQGTEDVCVYYGPAGSFCGGKCGEGDSCPAGFTCKDVQTTAGAKTRQCVADAGECACSDLSVQKGAWTGCAVENKWGRCEGKRTCVAEGLTPCSAAKPEQEKCDGADNDCDGLLDEESCDDGNSCTIDSCVAVTGCVHQVLPDGTECMDGDSCTWKDKCAAGECVGLPFVCEDYDECTLDECDPLTGDCAYPEDEAMEGETCGLLNHCTTEGICAKGKCKGQQQLVCDDAVTCTGNGCEPATGCVFTLEDSACDDLNPCSVDTCKPVWDEELGQWKPGSGCEHQLLEPGSACDDQDPCTAGETCQVFASLLLCQGPSIVDDGNPCTEDSCDPALGPIHIPLPDGTPCNMPGWDKGLCAQGLCACVPGCDGKECGDDGCPPVDAAECGKCSGEKPFCDEEKHYCHSVLCVLTSECEPGKYCSKTEDPWQCMPGCDDSAQCAEPCKAAQTFVCTKEHLCVCMYATTLGTAALPDDGGCLSGSDSFCLRSDLLDPAAPPKDGMESGSGKYRIMDSIIY